MEHRIERGSRVEWLIACVFAAGAAVFTLSFYVQPIEDPLGLAAVVALTALGERLAVRLYFDGRVSVSFAGIALAAILFGLPGAALAGTATAIAAAWPSGRSIHKLAFNFGLLNVVGLAAYGPAALVAIGSWPGDTTPIVAGALAGTAMFFVGPVGVSSVIAIEQRRPFLDVYRSNFAWLMPHYAGLGVVGGSLAVAYEHLGLAGVAVFALPVLLSRYAMKQVLEKTRDNVLRLERVNQQLQHANVEIREMSEQVREAYNGTLESLVTALDMRDQDTGGHSVRVAVHSLEIAKMLGINDEQELAVIHRGALMHDVGKIGVPDAILLKPAALTEEEWEFMRRHPAMGYRILAQVPYLRPAARIVLAHHERWDGDGYPRRLKGDSIPVGARIFAVSDTYDAIVSDRPYRKGQTPDAALAEILRCAGTQFDPLIVEAFEALFPRWREEEHDANAPLLYLPDWRQQDDAPGRAAG